MRNKNFFSVVVLKYIFVFGLLLSLTLSTTLESLSLLSENSFDIVNVDWQEDSEEEKEDKIEEAEKKIQTLHMVYLHPLFLRKVKSLNSVSKFNSNFFIEIHIPPPELGKKLS